MNLPVFRLTLDEVVDGIEKMSLVKDPAVEKKFMAFSKENDLNHLVTLSIDEVKRMVFGVALRCNYPIYRKNGEKEYFVVFDRETIEEAYVEFMKNPNRVNLNHIRGVEGVYLTDSFIKDTEKGLNPKGFEDIEDGSWFCGYKIENDEVWEKVKNGELNGFSVEGLFSYEDTNIEIEMKKEEKDEMETLIDKLLEKE